jgi:hypothetical protein
MVPSTLSGVSSMMWQKAFTASNSKPVLLLDRCPDKRHSPFWHLEVLQGLVSVTAFVDVSDCSVIAFEFRYNDEDIRIIGSPHVGAVRLSYFFMKGEVIVSIGCAQAKNNSGVAIKVSQSCST